MIKGPDLKSGVFSRAGSNPAGRVFLPQALSNHIQRGIPTTPAPLLFSLTLLLLLRTDLFEKVGCPAARHPSWELTLRIKDVVLNLEAVLPTEAAFAGLSVTHRSSSLFFFYCSRSFFDKVGCPEIPRKMREFSN